MSRRELIEQLAETKASLEELKREYIHTVIARCGGNKNQATKILGLNRQYLSALIKRHDWKEFFGWSRNGQA